MVSGTADSENYSTSSGTVTFLDGESSKTITIALSDDNTLEDPESFSIVLSNPDAGAELGVIKTLSVNIEDNDTLIALEQTVQTISEGDITQLYVSRTGDLNATVTVDYSILADSADASDYVLTSGTLTFLPGQQTQIIINDNDIIQSSISFSSSSKTIEEGSYVTLALVRTGSLSGTASAEYSFVSGTAGASDYFDINDTVHFADGESAKTITVATMDDSLEEATESFTILLSNPSEGCALGKITEVSLLIRDNDQVLDTFTFASGSETVDEGDSVSITVERTGSTEDEAEVDYLYVSGTADDEDYVETMGTVVFEAGETTATIKVKARVDTVDETSEYFYVLLYNPSDNVTIGDIATTIVVINNKTYTRDSRDTTQTATVETTSVTETSTTDYVKIVNDLTNVLVTKALTNDIITDQSTQTYYDKIEDLMQYIDSDDDIKLAMNDYVETVQLFENMDVEDPWIDLMLIERVQVFTETTANVENHEDLTEKFIKNIQEVEASRLNETGADLDKAIEEMVDVTLRDVGTIHDGHSVEEEDQVYTVTFNDIEDSSAKAEIEALLGKGIIDETASFDPGESITREEMATWIARSYGLENDDSEMPFEDVAQGSDHYSELAAAYESGIISGTSDTAFNPEGTVTKEEMAVMLANAMTQFEEKKLNENLGGELAQLSDRELIEDWADDEVAFLGELGILEDEDGALNPDAAVTKELAASIIKRISG